MKLTQQDKLLIELKKGKVNSYFATYNMRIKQAPTRIKELKEQGYNIVSKPNRANRSVDWELVSKPVKPKQPKYIFIGNKAIPNEEMVRQTLIWK
jgi:hypothetical protein